MCGILPKPRICGAKENKIMPAILEVQQLTKQYKDSLAVNNVSFEIGEGEVVGLVGPNGAGKTTIIHMILSLLSPSSGAIKIFGEDITRDREEILQKMNFATPYTSLPYNLTPYENLKIFSFLYGVKDRKEKVEKLLKDFHIEKFRNVRTGTLSSGEQMRLNLAKAFLNDPKLLLLDEPTASLDPAIAWDLRNAIYERMKALKGAVLWTSHNMQEIEEMCDRVLFLMHGKIVEQGTPKALRDKFKKDNLEDIFLQIVDESEKLSQHT